MISVLIPFIILILIFGLAFLLVEKWDMLQFQILSRLFFVLLALSTFAYIARFWIITGVDCIPDCIGVNLVNRDLRNFNLIEVNFVNANLNGANLSNVNLQGTNLIAASLVNANLQGANLSNARLMGADINNANLSGADLTGADLSGASLAGADLTSMDLTKVTMRGVNLSMAELENAIFTRTKLNSVKLSRAKLNGAAMQNVDLRGADLSGANLSGVRLSNSDLSGARLNLAILIGAELLDVDLTGATLIGATLTSADLSRSRMIGTHLAGANLKGANLADVDLTNAKMLASNIDERTILADPVLAELNTLQRNAILTDVSFHSANFNARTKWPNEEVAKEQANVMPTLDDDNLANAVYVGLLHSLTGPMSLNEVPVRDATLLAIEEINANNGVLGRNIYPIMKDGSSTPQTFYEKAVGLLEQDEVTIIFGCWTSDSRKAILPALEKFNGLLFYPRQYEGFEQFSNVFYFGSDAAQQILPAVEYILRQEHEEILLLGTESIFAQTVNLIVKARLNDSNAMVVGEVYVPLGQDDFSTLIRQLESNPPDMILNTMYGESNAEFFQQLWDADFSSFDIPVMLFGIAEEEIRQIDAKYMAGHLIISDYYQTLPTAENFAFVTAYKDAYGLDQVTSASIEAAYTAVYVWKDLVEQANSFAVEDIQKAAQTGQIQYISPGGPIRFDGATQQTYKTAHIGLIRDDGLIEEIESSAEPLRPNPYLTGYEWSVNIEKILENLKN